MNFNQAQKQYIAKLIKKAREEEREKIKKIIETRSFEQKIGGKMFSLIDIEELK